MALEPHNPVELPGPMNLFDLEHESSVRLALTHYQVGSTVIHPTKVTPRHVRTYMEQHDLSAPPPSGTPISITVPVLRVFGERLDAVSPEKYWDITSKTLMADLEPRLNAAAGTQLIVTITANGYKPTKRYSVSVG